MISKPGDENLSTQISVFTFLFGFFVVTHWMVKGSLTPPNPALTVTMGISVVAALISMALPHRLWPFVATIITFLLPVAVILPHVPNHIMLTSLMCAAILVGTAWAWFRNTDRRRLRIEAFATFVPVLRWAIIAMYCFAFLHKLNTSYFDPTVSCGWELYYKIKDLYPLLPVAEWMARPILLSALVIELLLPVLLIFSRTRLLGLAIALPFHLLLALTPREGIFGFSVELYTIFVVFMPAEAIAYAVRTLRAQFGRWLGHAGGRLFVGVLVILLGLSVLVPLLRTDKAFLHRIPDVTRQLAYLCMAVGIVGFVHVLLAPPGAKRYPTRILELPMNPTVILLPIVLFVGFQPYLGLNTRVNFSMFSNLRTEGGISNHFFLKNTGLLGDYQDDLVEIIDSSHNGLRRLSEQGLRLTYFGFIQIVARLELSDFYVVYRRGGQTERIDADNPPEIPPKLQRKLMIFRPVPPDGEPCGCRW